MTPGQPQEFPPVPESLDQQEAVQAARDATTFPALQLYDPPASIRDHLGIAHEATKEWLRKEEAAKERNS